MDPALRELLKGVETEELEVILKLKHPHAVPPHVRLIARFGRVVTGRVERRWIREVWGHPDVISFKAPRLLQAEPEIIDPESAGDVAWRDTDARRPAGLKVTGRGVVVGLVDVGCDFAHPHFRHPDGSSRLLALWDQSHGDFARMAAPYGYGAVYTQDDINRALAHPLPYQALGYHPAKADPQGIGAHGTLVLDIAAGNGRTPGAPLGLAPEADLIFVHASTGIMGGLANLGDSVRILEALDFIARAAQGRPWVVNISMGRRGGCHDGLSLLEQGMDELLLRTPGAAVVLSTGNYFQARAHASGELRPAQQRTLVWQTDRADITPNELEIWYSGKDVMIMEVKAPGGGPVFRITLAEDCPVLIEGRNVGHIYHRALDPNNGDNQINIFLRPEAPAGAWQITLIGEDIVDGRFHAWVERDAPCPHCDSRFEPRDTDPYCTTGTLCNGFRTVAAGAYDAHSPDFSLAAFSSCGPLRDFRQKPDLVAPGVRILGARSALPDRQPDSWLTRMSGTSFAAPHVTGTIALMFEAAGPPLPIQATRRLLLGSTRSGRGRAAEPVRLGSGYLDITRAVAAAHRFREQGLTDLTATPPGSANLRAAWLVPPPLAGLITTESTMMREDEAWSEDAPKTPPAGLSFKFNSKIIPRYRDKNGDNRLTNCTVVVPGAGRDRKEIDLLLFFHGLDTCDPGHDFDANKVVKIFELDKQVEAGKAAVALAVPALYWVMRKRDGSNEKEFDANKENIKQAWSAAQLNAFVEEVLDKIGEKSSLRPSLRQLILAGHSRAYDLMSPLANEFVSGKAATNNGALAKLAKVLAMDTTYGEYHAKILKKWAKKVGGGQFLLVLSVPEDYEPTKGDCTYKKNDPPIKYWDCVMQGVSLPVNLEVKKVSVKHCQLPNNYLKTVLPTPPKTKEAEGIAPEEGWTPMPVFPRQEPTSESGGALPEWSPPDEEPTEKVPERHVILISGGPGLFDDKSLASGIPGGFGAWERFVLPPYFKAKDEYGEFPATETYWWFVYRPAYAAKWKQDMNKLSSKDQEKVKNGQIKSYLQTINSTRYLPDRIPEWHLVWLDDADSFWLKLESFKKGSIAQVYYWGYASGADLWLSGGFKPDFPPEEFEIIKGSDIKRARHKDRFLPPDKKRPHRFVGSDTWVFAQEWARVFNVWTEGVVGNVNFVSITENANEPCRMGKAEVRVYSPGAKNESTNTARLPKCPVKSAGSTEAGLEDFLEIEEWPTEASSCLEEHGSGEDEPPALNVPALLVRLADEALARNQAISAGALVAEALSNARICLKDVCSRNGLLPSADTIFQAMTGVGNFLGTRFESIFTVITGPQDTLRQDLKPGDLLVRLAHGEPGLGHISIIARPELISRADLNFRGITPEGHRPGYYAVVIEGGSHPHRLDDNFARLVAGIDKRVPSNQMLLRVRPEMVQSMPAAAEFVEAGGVDTTAAVPDFDPTVRSDIKTPLLTPDQNKAAIKWNTTQHPTKSGVDPADIITALARYVDFKAVEQALKDYNKANPKAPVVMGTPSVDAVFAEAVHQFQVKTFVEAGQQDGKAGESTLDSLGLVDRSGLNSVDVANTRAQDRLNSVAAQVSKDAAGEFTAANWFKHMVNPSFLGQRVQHGIHLVLLRQLRVAEKHLLSQPAYQDMTPVELGTWMKITEMHKGARPTAKTASMHTFGLAMDINYEGNPWVAGQHLERDKTGKLTAAGKATQQANQEFTEAVKHATLLTAGVEVIFTPAYLDGLSKKKTEDILIELKNRDDNLRTYLGMEGDPVRIKQYLQMRQKEGIPGVFLPAETLDQAATRWQALIDQDLANLRKKNSNFETRDPKKGFLNLESPLVIALRDVAGLAWGAVDFGPRESGDMMHFDVRRRGVGLTLVNS